MPMSKTPTYESTRGSVKGLSLMESVLAGVAEDGGLLVPSEVPTITTEQKDSWKSLSYQELCFAVMRCYIGEDDIPDADLRTIISKAYSTFREPNCVKITPLVTPDGTCFPYYLLELFHGPTYAFKDFALQFLGCLLEYMHRNSRERLTVLAATSGDTGSAAIAGFRGNPHVNCVILFPKGRTSRIQELQMTTVPDANIHCVAVSDSTFDDCQRIVKEILQSPAKEKFHLMAANSINWARILAQMVYYWYGVFRLQESRESDRPIDIAVPTGNFGNILAAYYARRMGAPIRNLIIGSNSNDILTRFHETGCYEPKPVTPTMSPAMDIQVSSNLERLLYELTDHDALKTKKLFAEDLVTEKKFSVDADLLERFRSTYFAHRASEKETTFAILHVHDITMKIHLHEVPYIMDPHTAVGLTCAHTYKELRLSQPVEHLPLLIVATAHFAKFQDTVINILGSEAVADRIPEELRQLSELPQRVQQLPCNTDAIMEFLRSLQSEVA